MDNGEAISLGGNVWRMVPADEAWCERVAQTYDLPPHLARLLSCRHVAFDEVNDFLQPKLQKLMPDPYVLKDMQKAAERVAAAVMNGEKLAIIGDYDVDGATSTAELTRFLRAVGIESLIHIPSREEGYGPSDLAFAEFAAAGAKLVITIDCGTTAFDVLNRAAANGFEIIVVDHHEAETELPQVFAVVNPKRLDEENPYKHLEYMSAVGVGFMFLVAVNRILRQKGFYQNRTEPNLMNLLDLVA
ncbi:MAG: DHH family phosphoesterase, partial [Alphaproteobacteria bacterium]|nr:DHH family phosphoesterase [Alphaproteobacteria bacterium]